MSMKSGAVTPAGKPCMLISYLPAGKSACIPWSVNNSAAGAGAVTSGVAGVRATPVLVTREA